MLDDEPCVGDVDDAIAVYVAEEETGNDLKGEGGVEGDVGGVCYGGVAASPPDLPRREGAADARAGCESGHWNLRSNSR